MMKQQSKEFIAGYVFSAMEYKILKQLKSENIISGKIQVPKIWFGLPCSKNVVNTLPSHLKEYYEKALVELLHDFLPVFNYFTVHIYPKEQYMLFEFLIQKKELVKEMTLKQIENKLGYKIKLISEANHYEY